MLISVFVLLLNFAKFISSEEEDLIYVSNGDDKFLMGSTYQLRHLLEKELKFVEDLRLYHEFLKEEITRVETFLNATYSENFKTENFKNLEEYVSHPINAYGIIKRTNQGNIGNLKLDSNSICDTLDSLKNFTKISPTANDHFTAASSLALLQVSNFSNYSTNLLKSYHFISNRNHTTLTQLL